MTHQRKIAARQETGFVRPVLHQLPITQRIIQPLRGVVSQATKQHQIGATRHNVNGVDLQQRHALHGRKDIGGLRAATGLFKQPLRRKV